MNEKIETPVTKVPKEPHVHLIISQSNGEVVGLLSAGGAAMAMLLPVQAMDKDKFPVRKIEGAVTALGQDFYKAEREYVLAVRGAFLGLTWAEIQGLDKLLPQSAEYTFVVSQ